MENRNILSMNWETKKGLPPSEWLSVNDWDSHRTALWDALENTKGLVVEFGCGFGSTPLLEKYCKEHAREFISVDTDREYADLFPCTHHVEDIFTDFVLPTETELLFIDSKPGEQRKDLIDKYQYLAKVIVIHDSEKSSSYVYGLEPALSKFRFRADYKPEGKPHTTIVSNFTDVSKWKI
jgi:hypothetical protein